MFAYSLAPGSSAGRCSRGSSGPKPGQLALARNATPAIVNARFERSNDAGGLRGQHTTGETTMTGPTFLRALVFKGTALLLLAASAHAAPSIRYSWDACDPLVLDREFTGPGIYAQTLSVVGLSFPFTSFEASIAIGPGQPSAWAFFAGGCQPMNRLMSGPVADGCP